MDDFYVNMYTTISHELLIDRDLFIYWITYDPMVKKTIAVSKCVDHMKQGALWAGLIRAICKNM